MEKISRKKLIFIGSGLLLAGSLGIYGILYRPLIHKLKTDFAQCAATEKEVARARAAVASLKSLKSERSNPELLPESEIPAAINELTQEAKSKKIRFITLTPGQPSETTGTSTRVLPVEIEAESGYRELGNFLGSFERLPKGLFTLKGFEIFPDSKNPLALRSRLSLNLYLSGSVPSGASSDAESGSEFPRNAKKTHFESWGHSPFVLQKEGSALSASGLVLNGIAYDDKRPAAIINDKIVEVGGSVEKYKVVKITPGKVVLSDGFATIEIELNPEAAHKKL